MDWGTVGAILVGGAITFATTYFFDWRKAGADRRRDEAAERAELRQAARLVTDELAHIVAELEVAWKPDPFEWPPKAGWTLETPRWETYSPVLARTPDDVWDALIDAYARVRFALSTMPDEPKWFRKTDVTEWEAGTVADIHAAIRALRPYGRDQPDAAAQDDARDKLVEIATSAADAAKLGTQERARELRLPAEQREALAEAASEAVRDKFLSEETAARLRTIYWSQVDPDIVARTRENVRKILNQQVGRKRD